MKYFRLIGIMSLLVFSFYLTDAVTELAIASNPLMQSIKDNSKNFVCESVNATINNNTIIPGIKGKMVNEMGSFLNMKDFGAFNNNYLIYDYIKPDVSIEDNKNKIIISGNKSLRQISLLIRENKSIIDYLKNNNIKYSKLINIDGKLDSNENINIENEIDKFDNLNTLLNKKDLNKKICILNYSNIERCKELEYYIVKVSIELKNNNIVDSINLVYNGSIILIDDNLSLDNFKLFLSRVKNKDLDCKYLSEIIKE